MGERISYDQIVQEEKPPGGNKFLAVLIFMFPALLVPLAHFIYNWPLFPKLSGDEVIGFIAGGLGVFGGIFVTALIAIAGILKLIRERQEAKKRTTKVTGKIVEAELDSVFSGTMDVYTPVITYAYPVGKKTYTRSYWPHPNRRHNIMALHKKTLKRFVPGSEVPVYYDPKKPGESSLKRGKTIGFIIKFSILFLIAILFSLIIGAALTLLIRGFLLASLAGKIIVGVLALSVVVGLFFCTKYYLRES
jgi:hypothetical protein